MLLILSPTLTHHTKHAHLCLECHNIRCARLHVFGSCTISFGGETGKHIAWMALYGCKAMHTVLMQHIYSRNACVPLVFLCKPPISEASCLSIRASFVNVHCTSCHPFLGTLPALSPVDADPYFRIKHPFSNILLQLAVCMFCSSSSFKQSAIVHTAPFPFPT